MACCVFLMALIGQLFGLYRGAKRMLGLRIVDEYDGSVIEAFDWRQVFVRLRRPIPLGLAAAMGVEVAVALGVAGAAGGTIMNPLEHLRHLLAATQTAFPQGAGPHVCSPQATKPPAQIRENMSKEAVLFFKKELLPAPRLRHATARSRSA